MRYPDTARVHQAIFLAFLAEYERSLVAQTAPSFTIWYTGLCAHITRRILPVPKEPLIPLDPLDVADCPACPPPGAPYSSELFDEARAAAQSVWG